MLNYFGSTRNIRDCTSLEALIMWFALYQHQNFFLETLLDGADPIPFQIEYYLTTDRDKFNLTEDMEKELSKDLAYHVAGFLFGVVTEEEFNGGVMNCLTTSMVVEHCLFRAAVTMKTADNDAKQLEL